MTRAANLAGRFLKVTLGLFLMYAAVGNSVRVARYPSEILEHPTSSWDVALAFVPALVWVAVGLDVIFVPCSVLLIHSGLRSLPNRSDHPKSS